MGKKNYNDEMHNIIEEQRKLEKKLKMIPIKCSHTNNKGKLAGDYNNDNLFQCKKCKTKFSFTTSSLQQLREAYRLFHNAINQVKVFTDTPNEDMATIEKLGQLDYNLEEFLDLYKRVCLDDNGKKKKKKNKNHDNNSYGGYGTVSFIADKKKKKKSW